MDDHLNRQMTEQFNFGGGLLEKKTDSADPDADPDRHRSRKEVGHQLHVIKLPHSCKAAMSCSWDPTLAYDVCAELPVIPGYNSIYSIQHASEAAHSCCVCSNGQICIQECSQASHLSHGTAASFRWLMLQSQVMEEVMAKSKKFKAEKQHQREEDLNETEALDNKFKELMEGRIMAGMVRPKGEKGNAVKGRSEDAEGAAFDVMRRELVFDAKAKVYQVLCCRVKSFC